MGSLKELADWVGSSRWGTIARLENLCNLKEVLECGLVWILGYDGIFYLMSIAIYPGTFDPVTNGHLDVLKRAARMFRQVIVAVSADNSEKKTAFDCSTRVRLLIENIKDYANVEVEPFNGLLVDYAKYRGAGVVVRGLRAVSDFEYEFQMAQMNRYLDSELETIFLMPNEKYFYTSSSLIKQVHLYGNRVTKLVPDNVCAALRSLSLQNKQSRDGN